MIAVIDSTLINHIIDNLKLKTQSFCHNSIHNFDFFSTDNSSSRGVGPPRNSLDQEKCYGSVLFMNTGCPQKKFHLALLTGKLNGTFFVDALYNYIKVDHVNKSTHQKNKHH